jgi:hypothetical protein
MMEAARTSEMLVNFYQTTRRYNPKDSYLHALNISVQLASPTLCEIWGPHRGEYVAVIILANLERTTLRVILNTSYKLVFLLLSMNCVQVSSPLTRPIFIHPFPN